MLIVELALEKWKVQRQNNNRKAYSLKKKEELGQQAREVVPNEIWTFYMGPKQRELRSSR